MNPFYGLQTFGEIPEEWAAEIAARGWGRVRVEGDRYAETMAQCQRHDLWPLWVIWPNQAEAVPGGIDVELWNEPDAGCDKWAKLTPAQYRAMLDLVWPILRDKGCVLYIGAVTNMSGAAHAWLREVLRGVEYHPNLRVSSHRYPDGDQDVTTPKQGYRSLAAEEAGWLDVVKGRRWAISEAGLLDTTYRDWSSWRYFGKKRTRLAVDGHRAQAQRFQRLGADFYVVYQMQGPYGILSADGRWTPAATLPSLG